MELRIHPYMSYRGVRNWPPTWTRVTGPDEYPGGEQGILQEVRRSAVDQTRCLLLIQYGESRYIGSLAFDDQKHCEIICEFFGRHRGQHLHIIAGLPIDIEI